MDSKELTKHADRVLKCYRGFHKLANLSDKPFSMHGDKLVSEIDKAIAGLDGTYKAIIVNQYQTKTKDRKSRQQFCKSYNITMAEYNKAREIALVKFAKIYRNGALLELK